MDYFLIIKTSYLFSIVQLFLFILLPEISGKYHFTRSLYEIKLVLVSQKLLSIANNVSISDSGKYRYKTIYTIHTRNHL
jgi:hypothetical protein